jgi:hypothetical protein
MTPTYEQIEQNQREALRRALTVEALSRGLEPDAKLFERVSRDPASAGNEIRRVFEDRPPLTMLHFDTPGIQQFIFKVRRPVDIFGGSKLVADFTAEDPSREVSFYRHLAAAEATVPPQTVIYAGGGGGLLLVASAESEDVSQAIRGILRRETRGDLRTVTAVLEIWPEDLSATPAVLPEGLESIVGPLRPVSRYAATVAAVAARLSRERSRGASLAESIPEEQQFERCDLCGGKAASGHRYRGTDQERICDSCEARWRYGSRGKLEDQQANTFEDLVDGLPETALAVLYADGANVGRAFQRVGSAAQHRALSLAVDEAMHRATNDALAACPWLGEGEEIRVQTPIRGGDDLVLVLPAMAVFRAVGPLVSAFEYSFDFARNSLLRNAFADADEELRKEIAGFGVGIGIAIADFHFPIQFLVIYARELLKSAKRRIQRGARSAVDFMVLRSGTPLNRSVNDLRVQHFQREPANGSPGLRLTRRPYASDELAELVRLTELLGQVPTSQVHAIRQEIGRGYELSRSLWRYQHARAPSGKGWAAYREALGCDLAGVDELLWRQTTEGSKGSDSWLETDFLDALEILDLVNAPQPQGNPA